MQVVFGFVAGVAVVLLAGHIVAARLFKRRRCGVYSREWVTSDGRCPRWGKPWRRSSGTAYICAEHRQEFELGTWHSDTLVPSGKDERELHHTATRPSAGRAT